MQQTNLKRALNELLGLASTSFKNMFELGLFMREPITNELVEYFTHLKSNEPNRGLSELGSKA